MNVLCVCFFSFNFFAIWKIEHTKTPIVSLGFEKTQKSKQWEDMQAKSKWKNPLKKCRNDAGKL